MTRTARRATESPEVQQVLGTLRQMGDPAQRAGMRRFGIDTKDALGIRVESPAVRTRLGIP